MCFLNKFTSQPCSGFILTSFLWILIYELVFMMFWTSLWIVKNDSKNEDLWISSDSSWWYTELSKLGTLGCRCVMLLCPLCAGVQMDGFQIDPYELYVYLPENTIKYVRHNLIFRSKTFPLFTWKAGRLAAVSSYFWLPAFCTALSSSNHLTFLSFSPSSNVNSLKLGPFKSVCPSLNEFNTIPSLFSAALQIHVCTHTHT